MDGHSGSPGSTAITVAKSLAERLVGSIRRECLDHVIVFHEAGSRRILKDYFEYYERKMPYASVARKRCARQPTRRASFARSGDRDSESWRPASPLHAQSCLIEASLRTLA